MKRKIGIIAGNGQLPLVIAQEAGGAGHEVCVVAIKGEADPGIEKLVGSCEWIKLGQLGKAIHFFLKSGAQEIVMAGKITKTDLFKGDIIPDFDMVRVMMGVRDWKDDTLLRALADYLTSKGLCVVNSVELLGEVLPSAGVLTKRRPEKDDQTEIEFGWKMAKAIGGLDIGQTVVTKNKAVVAVESIEGTDEAILRGGGLASGSVNVFKVAKPGQDMRFDVPTLGMKTMNAMIYAGARMLVFEAEKTILLDREDFIVKADENKMIVVAKKDE